MVVLRCARYYRRHAKRLNLLALKAFKFYFVCYFLTAEKCGEILVALKIGKVKFILFERLCAISKIGFYASNRVTRRFKNIMRDGGFC